MMAARPAPRPKSKSGGSHPSKSHSIGGRNYRRVITQVNKWNKGPAVP
jgi:hypothetical protein